MKYWVIILLFIPTLNLFGQRFEEEEQVSDSSEFYGFAGPYLQLGIGNDYSLLGGVGAVIINDRVFIGGFGGGLISTIKVASGEYVGRELEMGLGGALLGVNLIKSDKINPIVFVGAGGGGATISDENGYSIKKTFDEVWYFTGGFEFGYKIGNYFMLAASAGYSFIPDLAIEGVDSDIFNGMSVVFTLKIGNFHH